LNQQTTQEIVGLRKKVLEKEFSRMNGEQREAVFQVDGPLLILAGAGSGKTTVLVNRIANLIRYGNAYHSQELERTPENPEALLEELQGYLHGDQPLSRQTVRELAICPSRPWQVLAITFTNKAAGELKNRLNSMLGEEEGHDIWASTFHSTCARMLRRDGDRIGYTSHFTIYDTDDSRRLMKECMKALNLDDKSLPIKSVLGEISRAKDNMIAPEDYQQQAGSDFRLCQIAKAYQMYQRRLVEADAMDFDDLLCNTVKLFRECPDVLEHYQNKFQYIMVDEYQDTNHVQYLFIELLARKSKNLCVVGDDDQSIYKFRGATIANIMDFEKTYPNATVIRLEQNYRSTKNILNAANAVIANNVSRKGKTLWTDNPEGKKISIHTAFSEQDEADHIAKFVLEGVAEGRKYSDYAILYRMNSQSNSLERMFVKSGIPYRIVGGLRFYERKEIKDMIAYLSVINNPSDEIRLRRIINQPKRSIGDKTIAQATEIAQGIGEPLFYVISHADQFESLKRTAPKLKQFADIMLSLIEASEDERVSLEELYQLILEKTNYIASLKSDSEDVTDRIENINELASNLIQYEEENGELASLSGFLEEVSLMTDVDQWNGDADAVVMMTMHSAKGLEFPVVFVPGFEEGIFPGQQAIYNPAEVEEERRLAYVAITRAREELHLLNAESRMIFGSTSRNKASRFLSEIPEELVERSRSRSWKKPVPGTELPTSAYEARAVTTNAARHFGPINMAKQSQGKTTYQPGDRVGHGAFGEGMILSAVPMGNDTLLEIAFDSAGTKKLMANFARLKKL
jgi:DNA helicase-2/ATP-dependent DNA helicase PcrA